VNLQYLLCQRKIHLRLLSIQFLVGSSLSLLLKKLEKPVILLSDWQQLKRKILVILKTLVIVLLLPSNVQIGSLPHTISVKLILVLVLTNSWMSKVKSTLDFGHIFIWATIDSIKVFPILLGSLISLIMVNLQKLFIGFLSTWDCMLLVMVSKIIGLVWVNSFNSMLEKELGLMVPKEMLNNSTLIGTLID